MTLIKELPADERPREKMRRLGAGRLSNAELLAILLGTGARARSATDLANSVISMDEGGIHYLSECTPEELAEIEGIGAAKSCQIVAAVELGKRLAAKPGRRRVRVGRPDDAVSLFLEDMRYLKQERFKVLLLNIKNEIMGIEEVSIGSINMSLVDPREVFRLAVKRGAASVVLAHNHPSGNPEPSDADIEFTKRLMEAGDVLGVKVVDHLVIGDGVYCSMRRKRMI
jgi:DNA repair protein RadC